MSSWVNFFREDHNGEVSPISVFFNSDKDAKKYVLDLAKIDTVFSISHTTEPSHHRRIDKETGRML